MKAIFKGKIIPSGQCTGFLERWTADEVTRGFLVSCKHLKKNLRFSVRLFVHHARVEIDGLLVCLITRVD